MHRVQRVCTASTSTTSNGWAVSKCCAFDAGASGMEAGDQVLGSSSSHTVCGRRKPSCKGRGEVDDTMTCCCCCRCYSGGREGVFIGRFFPLIVVVAVDNVMEVMATVNRKNAICLFVCKDTPGQ